MLLSTFAFSAFAAEENVITYEQYFNTIKNECAKYGIEAVPLYDRQLDIYTVSLLNEVLVNIADLAQRKMQESQSDIEIVERVNEDVLKDILHPRVMPCSVELVSDGVRVSNLTGWADICIELSVTMDAQNSYVFSVDEAETYQYGGYVNFVSWEELSVEHTINNNTHEIFVVFVGNLTTVQPLVIPDVGLTSEETGTYTFSLHGE